MLLSAFHIQKNFKRKYLHDFPIRSRQMARARDNLLIFSFSVPDRLMSFVKIRRLIANAASNSMFQSKWMKVGRSARLIQSCWRAYKTRLTDMFDEVCILWDLIVKDRRRQKKKKDARAKEIPLGIKSQYIGEYMEGVRGRMISDVLSGSQIVWWRYWPSDK